MGGGAIVRFHRGIVGFPHGDQVCFDPKTGACSEDSPDVVAAVEGRNADGSCNLSFTRSFGHFAEDVLPSEPGIVGAGAGLLASSALGFATTGNWRGAAVGAATGLVSGLTLGEWARPLGEWLGSRGYVPRVGASSGIANPVPNLVDDATWQAKLYVGASQRQRPLLTVFYPEFKLGVTLIGEAVSPRRQRNRPQRGRLADSPAFASIQARRAAPTSRSSAARRWPSARGTLRSARKPG